MVLAPQTSGAGTPFDLDNTQAYDTWATWKLKDYPQTSEDLIVEIRDPLSLTAVERAAIVERCRKTNMAIYTLLDRDAGNKKAVQRLGEQLGLSRLDRSLCADADGITSVRVIPSARQQEYIPYTNRALNWHTDGYYNHPDKRICAFIMHCARDAVRGGETALLDPEVIYLLVRNENPAYITALMQSDVMTIPANIEQGMELRGAETGPVFSFDKRNANLHMRYTARKHNIQWKNDSKTRVALEFLESILQRRSQYIFRIRLQPGQGLICNNVLHSRTAFEDDVSVGRGRLLYRTRYYDRIAGTSLSESSVTGDRHALA